VILLAIDDLNIHRDDEGKSLEKDLLHRVHNILAQLEEVQKLEPNRKQIIRDDITKLMEEFAAKKTMTRTGLSRN
jgi:uncharacterized protein YicC (UPF0701 family)